MKWPKAERNAVPPRQQNVPRQRQGDHPTVSQTLSRSTEPSQFSGGERSGHSGAEGGIASSSNSDTSAASRGSHRSHQESYIERSKKRVVLLQEGVVKAQATVVEAQTKLVAEEEALREGEQRLVTLEREASCLPQPDPLLSVLADHAQELAQLRSCVQELKRERDDLRTELSRRGERRSRGRSRSLADPSLDLVMGKSALQCMPPPIKSDGDNDRQCRVTCQVKSQVQPNVRMW